ncbi:MAG: peptide chain release factor N(5)-glutamine methyltransferase [Clostridia bacterium]|nr:peptide chain release factor N(5)-glutamine methyltransferase [Clostridia bacterium]
MFHLNIRDFLKKAQEALSFSPDADIEAVWLVEECLSLPRSRVRTNLLRQLTEAEEASLTDALTKRVSGMPIQYIFRRAPFMGYEFYVDERVLIPRMDTENLCDAAYNYISRKRGAKVLDLCAGSGAIGISLKKMCPHISLTLSDISPDAGEVQKINAAGLTDVEILTGDMFDTVAGRKFDLIVCNPPYIPSRDIPGLQAEVLREPSLALDGGDDGLDFYRQLAENHRLYLNEGGRIYMEIGYDQAEAVCALFEGASVIKDLNGLDRIVWTEV